MIVHWHLLGFKYQPWKRILLSSTTMPASLNLMLFILGFIFYIQVETLHYTYIEDFKIMK